MAKKSSFSESYRRDSAAIRIHAGTDARFCERTGLPRNPCVSETTSESCADLVIQVETSLVWLPRLGVTVGRDYYDEHHLDFTPANGATKLRAGPGIKFKFRSSPAPACQPAAIIIGARSLSSARAGVLSAIMIGACCESSNSLARLISESYLTFTDVILLSGY